MQELLVPPKASSGKRMPELSRANRISLDREGGPETWKGGGGHGDQTRPPTSAGAWVTSVRVFPFSPHKPGKPGGQPGARRCPHSGAGGCGPSSTEPGRRASGPAQLLYLQKGPDKPQRELPSAFPGQSAGRRARSRRAVCSKHPLSADCLWPAAPSRAPVARAPGPPGDMCWAQLGPSVHTCRPPHGTPAPPCRGCPTLGQAPRCSPARGQEACTGAGSVPRLPVCPPAMGSPAASRAPKRVAPQPWPWTPLLPA